MDISKYLKNINKIDDYVDLTQEFINKYSGLRIRLTMSTVTALNTIKSWEIEYFNKIGENGVAILIFRSLLNLPDSKIWSTLGKELIMVLRYWFDALQHLVQHNNWGNFLCCLLEFVRDMRLKDPSINNTILEGLSDSLLALVTHQQVSLSRQHEIVQCFNACSAHSSRERRLDLRNKLEQHFVKLSVLMSHCGDFRVQYSVLETLMRWLIFRHESSVRKQAAEKLFPANLYSQYAVDIFLQKSWIHFYRDARDFLNAQNEINDLITSVHCRKFIIGHIDLITDTDNKVWLDLNIGSKNVSFMLDLQLLKNLNTQKSMSNVLVITEDNTTSVKMSMEESLIKIVLDIIDPKQMYHSEMLHNKHEVKIFISPANAVKVNDSLTKIFGGKYQLLIDLDKTRQMSIENTSESCLIEDSEDNSRFSNPTQVRRIKHSGVITRLRKPGSRQSPTSTASTSTLLLLREKADAFLGRKFAQLPVSESAFPQLHRFTEVNEGQSTKISSSCIVSQNNNDPADEKFICSLGAKVGSVNDSDTVINTDNIVNLLVREALQSKQIDKENTVNIQNIEEEAVNNSKNVQNRENIDSHFEITNNNTALHSVRSDMMISKKKKVVIKKNQPNTEIQEPFINNNSPFNSKVTEDIFTQHFQENKTDDLMISPSLAQKINETSSETSEDLPKFDCNEIEIEECLNDLVDKVCEELDNYKNKEIHFLNITNTIIKAGLQKKASEIVGKEKKSRKITPIVLKFKSTKETMSKKNKKQKETKLEKETVNKMSIIYENDSVLKDKMNDNDKHKSPDTKQVRRKRKLYSPKDEHNVHTTKSGVNVSETEEDDTIPLCELKQRSTISKSKATSYKEISQIKRSTRKIIGNIKKRSEPSLLPTSKKNCSYIEKDVFNNLNKTVENNVINTKPNKNLAVYNFRSDSDDSDFKTKIKTYKKTVASTRSCRNVPRKSYSEIEPRAKGSNRKKNIKREKATVKISREELIDERMREPIPETLNTSIEIDFSKETPDNLQPNISFIPQMEVIDEQTMEKCKSNSRPKRKTKRSKKKDQLLKKGTDKEDRFTPLPALIVEPLLKHNELDDSVIALEKLQDTCENESFGECIKQKTIQSLHSDDEQINYSPLNNLHYLDRSESSAIKNTKNKNSRNQRRQVVKGSKKPAKELDRTKKQSRSQSSDSSSSVRSDALKLIEVIAVIEDDSLKSIPTVGKSPIRGHGDSDEIPPTVKQLEQTLQPRDLEIEYLDDSIKDYHNTLAKETLQLWKSNSQSDRTRDVSKDKIPSKIWKAPSVSIKRLSLEEINEWIPPQHNAVLDSDQRPSTDSRRVKSQNKKDKTATPPTTNRIDKFISPISPIKLFAPKPKLITEDNYDDKIKSQCSESVGTGNKTRFDFRKRRIESVVHITPKRSKSGSAVKTSSPIESSKPGDTSVVSHEQCAGSPGSAGAISESVATTSVSNWLNRSRVVLSSLPPESFETYMYRDNLKLVLEKMDTSLVEIHHSTNIKLNQLFVDTQNKLKQNAQTREQLFRDSARDMVDVMLRVFDGAFKKLDDKCKEMDEQIRNNLKEQTCQLISEDSKKKQLFIDQIKQDILRSLREH